MRHCNGCGLDFDLNELDDSGFCYECATYDPDPKPDLMAVTVIAAKQAFQKLAKIAGFSQKNKKNDTN